jgi:hypothetical protein
MLASLVANRFPKALIKLPQKNNVYIFFLANSLYRYYARLIFRRGICDIGQGQLS